MGNEPLIERVRARLGPVGDDEAGRAIETTLGVLADFLTRSERESIARYLPARWAEPLHRGGAPANFELDELYLRVAAKGPFDTLALAVEQTHVVCEAVGEELSPAAWRPLRRSLPAELAALFEPRQEPLEPGHLEARPTRTPRGRHTLSEGRPGFGRPLAEASAVGQRDSVLASNNPHASTKLSSARGPSSVRQARTIAEGHPTPRHPVDE